MGYDMSVVASAFSLSPRRSRKLFIRNVFAIRMMKLGGMFT
ncbi:hypothetical protein J3E61_006791 [Mycobacterium sp. OAE908]